MIWGLLCFQSPGWFTQLPVIFALCGFVLGHFLTSGFGGLVSCRSSWDLGLSNYWWEACWNGRLQIRIWFLLS